MVDERPKRHHLIEFAARNASVWLPTFNAVSVIWRLEELLDDVKSLQQLRAEAERNSQRWGNRGSTYEIVNYYVVGFATCLEWHARSRMADLLDHMPSLIETTDVRTIDKAVLSQMSAEKVTLPYILGAATSVSSVREYAAVFTRIFEGLGLFDHKAENLLREQVAEGPKWRVSTHPPLTIFDALNELFETRSELVHEIGPNQMAHFSLRDMWDLDEARRVGEIALLTVRTLEAVITRTTPVNFPNRLDEEGQPQDELNTLKREIARIEDEITAKLAVVDVWNDSIVWEQSLIAQRAAMEAEIKFLEDAGFLRPVRHLDLSLPAKTGYLRNRLAYLTALREELRKTLGS